MPWESPVGVKAFRYCIDPNGGDKPEFGKIDA
jgi:hypothetical protein